MKILYQILLGIIPITALLYVFFTSGNNRENSPLVLAKSVCKNHYLLLVDTQLKNKDVNELSQLSTETLNQIKKNLINDDQIKHIKFLINSVNLKTGNNEREALIVTQSLIYTKPKTFFNKPDKVHVIAYANGKIEHLNNDQYNQLDLSKFITVNEITK